MELLTPDHAPAMEDANLSPSKENDDEVNYMDIKITGIVGIPNEWVDVSGDPPGYESHPFRYEIYLDGLGLSIPIPPRPASGHHKKESLSIASKSLGKSPVDGKKVLSSPTKSPTESPVMSKGFTHGRLLRPLPTYMKYIRLATPPGIHPSDDALDALRETPEALDLAVHKNALAEGSSTFSSGAVNNTNDPMPPAPMILFISTPLTDLPPAPIEDPTLALPGGKKKKNRKSSVPLLQGGNNNGLEPIILPPPPLPSANEAPPCVLRIRLTAPLEATLQKMIREGLPLIFRLRRVLRPGAPNEWEDLNESYYAALAEVNLTALAEPGSTALVAKVPLVPLVKKEQQENNNNNNMINNNNNNMMNHTKTATTMDAQGLAAQEKAVEKKKKSTARRAKAGIPSLLIESVDLLGPHPYETYHTSCLITLTFKQTLSRLVSDRVRPGAMPVQLIPTRQKLDQQGRGKGMEKIDLSDRFIKAIKSIAVRLFEDYKLASPLTQCGLDGDASLEEKERWRENFIEYFQSTGQLAVYKSELTGIVTEIVHERFALPGNPTGGDEQRFKQTLSEQTNALYVHLLEMMHVTLKELVDTALHGNNNDHHNNTHDTNDHQRDENTATNDHQGDKAVDTGRVALPASFPVLSLVECGWRERAWEAEFCREYISAEHYHHARIASCCTRAINFAAAWSDAAAFYFRIGDSLKAEHCYREAIACEPTFTPALVGYGLLLLAYERLDEAAVFLHGVVDAHPKHYLAWGLLVLLYDLHLLTTNQSNNHNSHHHSHTNHGTTASESTIQAGGSKSNRVQWEKERNYCMECAVQCFLLLPTEQTTGAETNHGNEENKVTPTAQGIGMQVQQGVAALLLELHHRELANLCLARCTPGDPRTELLYAYLFLQGGEYSETRTTLSKWLSPTGQGNPAGTLSEALQAVADLLFAQTEEGLGNTKEAIEWYKKALALGTNAREEEDLTMRKNALHLQCFYGAGDGTGCFLRLGNLLMAEGKYKDALGVFSIAIQRWQAQYDASRQGDILPRDRADPLALAPACKVDGIYFFNNIGALLCTPSPYVYQTIGCGTLWLGAGIAYYRIGQYDAAEDCLNESSMLNPLNPRTWAYLTLVCLKKKKNSSSSSSSNHTNHEPTSWNHNGTMEETLQLTFRHGLLEVPLWVELGTSFLLAHRQTVQHLHLNSMLPNHHHHNNNNNNDGILHAMSSHSVLLESSERCLQKALQLLQDGPSRKQRSRKFCGTLLSNNHTPLVEEEEEEEMVAKFHLAQVRLARLKTDDAKKLLTEVAQKSRSEVLRAKAEEDLTHLAS